MFKHNFRVLFDLNYSARLYKFFEVMVSKSLGHHWKPPPLGTIERLTSKGSSSEQNFLNGFTNIGIICFIIRYEKSLNEFKFITHVAATYRFPIHSLDDYFTIPDKRNINSRFTYTLYVLIWILEFFREHLNLLNSSLTFSIVFPFFWVCIKT